MLGSSDGVRRSRLLPAIGVVVLLAGLLGLVALNGRVQTSEISSLSEALDLNPGDTGADIGAGTGWLSIETAQVVGLAGHVYATELNPERRATIRTAATEAGVDITVVEAGLTDVNLPAACC